jgi:hypothetical protein
MKPSRRGWRRSLSAGTCSPGTASSCAKRTSRNNPNARSAGVSVKNRMSSSRVISGKPRAEPAPPSRTPASAPQHPRTTDMTRHNSLYPLIFRHLDPVPQYGQNVAEVDLTARRRLPHHHSSEAYTSKISSGLYGHPLGLYGHPLRKLLGTEIRGISPGQRIAVAALWILRQRPTRKTISIVTSSNSLVGGS